MFRCAKNERFFYMICVVHVIMDVMKLKEEQLKLAKKVITTDSFEKIKTIAGVDQAFFGKKTVSAIVVCDYKTKKVLEKKYAIADVTMPYVPCYLSYREAPVIVEAYTKLENRPDILIVDGNGILHPRRIGLASHVGILLDQATIGIAKNLLLGEISGNNIIVDKEIRAVKLKTKEFSKPVFVSPGHRISLKTSVEIVKNCIEENHKLPEPVHLAHRFANKIRDGKKKVN